MSGTVQHMLSECMCRCKCLCVYMWLMCAVTSLVRSVYLAALQMHHISLCGCGGEDTGLEKRGGWHLWQMARSVPSSQAIPVGTDVRNWMPVTGHRTVHSLLCILCIRLSTNLPDLSSTKRSSYPCCSQLMLKLREVNSCLSHTTYAKPYIPPLHDSQSWQRFAVVYWPHWL